ncbi:uncharacterized protein LOC129717656 [Wyeomyia smithii]|uniref:uncharacterized protein LOC129717656 n=1 Tax=Wyeomyia smithii TaxID=174621 RepID=UPI002467B482|nr:uncharacterized protein LOC129717656 [Wyeomyia smithii]
MSIKPELVYNAKKDIFYGFPYTGTQKKIERNRTSILATEAIVIMVSGLGPLSPNKFKNDTASRSGRFKQAIGYMLAHHSLETTKQLNMITNAVQALKGRGLYPLALILDQCTTNVKMIHEAGAIAEKPIIMIDSAEIAVFYDNPHLIKNTKSMLSKHNAVFKGKIASFSHIRQLYLKDQICVPRLVPKLTEKLINPRPFMAMNVAQATRTLSHSVAVGLEYYALSGDLPLSALTTASFVIFF